MRASPAPPATSRRLPPAARRRPRRLGRPICPAASPVPPRFVHLSFEGPDPYSTAGGLSVRVSNLTRALAATGSPVDLYFVGDPDRPGREERDGVTLHRWCQGISAGARAGVYDEEERKIEDLCLWWPSHVAEVVGADAGAGRRTVVLAEDWHAAWPLIGLDEELGRRGLRDRALLGWTANNRFGFERIDFERLASSATVLTISRAMKHLMWQLGVNPLVVPNGIPDEALTPLGEDVARAWTRAFAGVTTLAKVGRWDPDKRWVMAIETVARLRRRGDRAVLLARGWNGSASASGHYAELRARAADLGVGWSLCRSGGETPGELAVALRRAIEDGTGIVEATFPVGGPRLQALYAASDAVLANSGFEPFGLVGLEAMAAGAIVVAGATGEDYVAPFRNGFSLDTDDPAEIVSCLDWLRRDAGREATMRAAARATASDYRWPAIVERLRLTLGLPEPAPASGPAPASRSVAITARTPRAAGARPR